MRAQRSNLEDQVGGLVGHDGGRTRWRAGRRLRTVPVPEPVRYELAAPAIRAEHATDVPAPRQVA